MTNEKLASHISSKLWNVSKDEIVEILASYEEEEKPIVKHPIELVNEKYPSGWYCEAFEELKQDVIIASNDNDWYFYNFIAYCPNYSPAKQYNNYDAWDDELAMVSVIDNLTKITPTEYLSITRPQQKVIEIPKEPTVYEDIEFLTNRLNHLEDKFEKVDNIIANLLKQK